MTNDRAYDVIIVLGARIRPDCTPCDALLRRLTLARECYIKQPEPVICCGGQGDDEPCSEADCMCDWLASRGVPRDRLIAEGHSHDTLQNISNAADIMRARGLKRALVVTSDYHVRRALAVCRRYGVEAVGIGSRSDIPFRWKQNLRECLAWVKFLLTWRPGRASKKS